MEKCSCKWSAASGHNWGMPVSCLSFTLLPSLQMRMETCASSEKWYFFSHQTSSKRKIKRRGSERDGISKEVHVCVASCSRVSVAFSCSKKRTKHHGAHASEIHFAPGRTWIKLSAASDRSTSVCCHLWMSMLLPLLCPCACLLSFCSAS